MRRQSGDSTPHACLFLPLTRQPLASNTSTIRAFSRLLLGRKLGIGRSLPNRRRLPMPSHPTDRNVRVADWPLYWFARLEKAVEQGDHAMAAAAQRRLATLGVRVRYGRPERPYRS